MAETSMLMTIGRFSSLTRLSVRMLRHYDSHGVLVPAVVDPVTGYRWYAPHQLEDAAAIRNLRDVGFGVSAIGALLDTRGTAAWTRALQLQRAELHRGVEEAQHRVSLITRLLEHGDPLMSITVTRATLPAMTIVTLRGTVPTYSDEGRLWGQLMPLLAQSSIAPIGPCGVIEHDDEYVESDVDLSIFAPVAPGTRVDPPLLAVDLPARDCLVARVVGPYDQISHAHDLINTRMAAESLAPRPGEDLAARAFNIYLATPDRVAEADLVTDVCLPVV